jgi:hypothetical protein
LFRPHARRRRLMSALDSGDTYIARQLRCGGCPMHSASATVLVPRVRARTAALRRCESINAAGGLLPEAERPAFPRTPS